MAPVHLQIRKGWRSQKIIFRLFGPQFGLKIRGEGVPAGPSPGSATAVPFSFLKWRTALRPKIANRLIRFASRNDTKRPNVFLLREQSKCFTILFCSYLSCISDLSLDLNFSGHFLDFLVLEERQREKNSGDQYRNIPSFQNLI